MAEKEEGHSVNLASIEVREAFNNLTDLKITNDVHVIENFIKTVLPLAENPTNVDYIVKRLTLGVTSTRKAVHFPFANALWAFLVTKEASDVSGETVFQLIEQETELNRLLKMTSLPEDKQAQFFGCLTVCTILAKVRKYVNLKMLSTLHKKFLNPSIELKGNCLTIYSAYLSESLEVISKADYKQNLWPTFSNFYESVEDEMSPNPAIELFMLIRRCPKLVSQIVSVDKNSITNLKQFSLDNFITFHLATMPFLHPYLNAFLKTFKLDSKMFGKFWTSLLQRREAAAVKLTWLVFSNLPTEGVTEEQMQFIFDYAFLTLLNGVNLENKKADDTFEIFKKWVSKLGDDDRTRFLWHILRNCSTCPKFLSNEVFQESLMQEDIKEQRNIIQHIEEQIFSSAKSNEVEVLVKFVSKFSSILEKNDQKSRKLRTTVDKILIKVSLTKAANHKKPLSGKTIDVLFHAIRTRLLSSVGDFAQEVFHFVSTDSKSASTATKLILSSDSTESYPYIKQLVSALVLDICIHNEVEESYVFYLRSLLHDVRKIPEWVNFNGGKTKKNGGVLEIDNVVLTLIKLMNIPNKFYNNLAYSFFNSVCKQHQQDLDEISVEKICSVPEKLKMKDTDAEESGEGDSQMEQEGESLDDGSGSSDESSEEEEDDEDDESHGGEAAWEKEYFAQEDAQIELTEDLDAEQFAQLEKFDKMWQLKMQAQKKPAFQVSDANSLSNFFHLLDVLLKDPRDEAILKSCFLLAIKNLARNLKENESVVIFEFCAKILVLRDKMFIETLKKFSSEERKDVIMKTMKAMFCASFPLKPKAYSTACKIISTLMSSCDNEAFRNFVFKHFLNKYFFNWANSGKYLNLRHFLDTLFQIDQSLFWSFLKHEEGTKFALRENASCAKRLNLVLTQRRLSQVKAAESDFLFFFTLCHLFLDAALYGESVMQKQNCVQTVHAIANSINLKETLKEDEKKLNKFKGKLSRVVDDFKSLEINHSCKSTLKALASDFDINLQLPKRKAEDAVEGDNQSVKNLQLKNRKKKKHDRITRVENKQKALELDLKELEREETEYIKI